MFRAASTFVRSLPIRVLSKFASTRGIFLPVPSRVSLRQILRVGAVGAGIMSGAYILMHRDSPFAAADFGADVTRLEKVFSKYATVNVDNVWYLSRDDFIKLVLSADVSATVHQSDSELDVLFRVADQNRDNLVSLSDFKMFYSFLTNPESEFELAFKMFDSDGNGEISKDEFIAFMQRHGTTLTMDEGLLLPFFGEDGSKKLAYHDFKQFLNTFRQSLVDLDFFRYDQDRTGFISGEQFANVVIHSAFADDKVPSSIKRNLQALLPEQKQMKISRVEYGNFFHMLERRREVERAVRLASSPEGIDIDTFIRAVRAGAGVALSANEASIIFRVFGNGVRIDTDAFFSSLHSSHNVKLAVVDVDKKIDTQTRRSAMEQFVYALKSFAMGGIAGAIGAVVVYPIDLVKTRMQAQRNNPNAPQKYSSTIDCFKKTFRSEGFVGFYKGLGPQLVGVAPEKAIKLVVNDLVRKSFGSSSSPGMLYLPLEILAGSAAGASQVVFTNPLEIVKIRLQMQGELPADQRKGAMTIVRELGLKGLYKGSSACFLRDVPFSGIYFPIYGAFKELFKDAAGQLTPFDLLCAGSLAGMLDFVPCAHSLGMFAASTTTPADVIKTRLQIEARKGESTYNGIVDCAVKIFKQEGPRALLKGVLPRVVRSSPQFGVTLLAYELLQKALDPNKDLGAPLALPLSEDDLQLLELSKSTLQRVRVLTALPRDSQA